MYFNIDARGHKKAPNSQNIAVGNDDPLTPLVRKAFIFECHQSPCLFGIEHDKSVKLFSKYANSPINLTLGSDRW